MFNIRSLLILTVAAFSGVNSAVLLNGGTDLALRSRGELALRANAAETCTLWSLIPNTASLRASCDDRTGAPHICLSYLDAAINVGRMVTVVITNLEGA
ncbi:hypothetical protein B0H19DRAFT_1196055 [Mycena capillaripes]|nr:hypothetical protein B0H19DRAFT_1196055 [Mycena capillaripes]